MESTTKWMLTYLCAVYFSGRDCEVGSGPDEPGTVAEKLCAEGKPVKRGSEGAEQAVLKHAKKLVRVGHNTCINIHLTIRLGCPL